MPSSTRWRSYYRVARIFQKYLETYHPEELMKISDYRDYLNATNENIYTYFNKISIRLALPF